MMDRRSVSGSVRHHPENPDINRNGADGWGGLLSRCVGLVESWVFNLSHSGLISQFLAYPFPFRDWLPTDPVPV